MPPLQPATADLADRRPVWEALSELFLDTDPALSRSWRVAQLARSPYSLAQLEHILVDEVHPVCKYNLLSVAGVWSGFDAAWLEATILRRLRSRWRFAHALNLGRLSVPACGEWRATRHAVLALRSAVQGDAA